MRIVIPILNRFTTLPAALDVLFRQQLTLLSPDTWEDRDDAYFLEKYCSNKQLGSLLAICFSLEHETFHHWRVFSEGSAGVCIEFDKRKLLRSISTIDGLRTGKMQYKSINALEINPPNIQIWPFLKRRPFEPEREFRIIFESKTEKVLAKSIDIDLSAIRKITLSPWMPKPVADSVIKIISSIKGCEYLKVNKSSLLENSRWRKTIESNITK